MECKRGEINLKIKNKKFHIYNFIYSIKNLTYIFSFPLILVFILGNIPIFSTISYLIYFYVTSILIFSIVLCIKLLIHINKTVYIRNTQVKIKSGIINKKTIFINLNNISSLFFKQSLINRILKIYDTLFVFPVKIYNLKNGIFLNKSQIQSLKNSIVGKDKILIFSKIKFYDFIILLFSYNNVFSFLILVFSISKKFQKILEAGPYIKIFFLLSKLPLLYIIILSILVVFLIITMKFAGLYSEMSNDKIIIRSGIFLSSEIIIPHSQISALSFKTNPINIIVQKKIMYIHSNKNKFNKGISILGVIPLNKCAFDKVYPLGKELFKIRPNKKSFFSYLYFPILSYIFALGIYILLFGFITKIVTFLLTLITLTWLFIRIYSFKNANLTLTAASISISSYKSFYFYEAIIPRVHIKKLKISQSPLQILSKRCNVHIYSSSDIKEIFKIKHLNVKNVENLVETLENSHINY